MTEKTDTTAVADLFTAVANRDDALARVNENARPWSEIAIETLPWLRRETDEMTGEQIRLWLQSKVGSPHHHNAWGGLIMRAVRSGIIVNTNRYVPMQSKKSHARKTPVYVWSNDH